jgi:hypothetical protein
VVLNVCSVNRMIFLGMHLDLVKRKSL